MSEQYQQQKKATRSTKKDVKPSGFAETERLAKNLMNAKGDSYFKWIHEKHKEIIMDFTLDNQDKLEEIAKQ